MHTLDCPHCQASQSAIGTAPGMRVSCSTCGEPFVVPSAPPPVRPQADMDRIRANRELGRAFRAAKAARVFLVTMAVVYGVFSVITLLVIADSPAPGALTWAVAIFGIAATALFIVASVRILEEPLAWTLVAAIAATLIFGLGRNGFLAILAAGAWAAFAAVLPASRLMKQYPDLRIARKLGGGSRSDGRREAGRGGDSSGRRRRHGG